MSVLTIKRLWKPPPPPECFWTHHAGTFHSAALGRQRLISKCGKPFMSLGSDLAVPDPQTKIAEFLAPDRTCPDFWSRQGKGQAFAFRPPLWAAWARSVQKGWLALAGAGHHLALVCPRWYWESNDQKMRDRDKPRAVADGSQRHREEIVPLQQGNPGKERRRNLLQVVVGWQKRQEVILGPLPGLSRCR